MKRVFFGVFFVLILLISAAAHLPAHIALGFISPLPGIKLDGLSGTIWNGSAASFHFQGKSLGSLDWEFNFFPLVTGKLDLSVGLSGVAGLSVNGHIGYGFSGIYANDLRLLVPASTISPFLPAPVPVGLSGRFELLVRDYQMSKPLCNTLDGNLTWSQAQVVTPIGTVELGPVVAQLSCKAGSVVATGKSKSEAIETEFSVSLAPNKKIKAEGLIKPGMALPEGLKSQLNWLGEPDNEGRYQLNFNG